MCVTYRNNTVECSNPKCWVMMLRSGYKKCFDVEPKSNENENLKEITKREKHDC